MKSPLNVAVLHYHLRRGGVTKVIEHSSAALAGRDVRLCVLVGEKPSSDPGVPVKVVDSLAYGTETADSEALVGRLRESAREALGGDPQIWHIHNHSLGKNLVVPRLVDALARRGERILLQPHDFAEDCRPTNYSYLSKGLGEKGLDRLYPCSERIHYAVLNGRDMRFLSDAGAPPNSLHLLPNPAPQDMAPVSRSKGLADMPDGPLMLYPTRGIRRKNIGELLLWATLAAQGEWFGVTLAPRNPVEQPLYRRWVALANELRLPVEFELGERFDLQELFAAAEMVVTTSLAEGYGMVFLEPWMAGRPVTGRDLPEITGDFSELGINLEPCYERLDIPVEWAERNEIEREIAVSRRDMLAKYGKVADAEDIEAVLAVAIRNGMVDFGCLGERLQTKVLRRVSDSRSDCGELQARLAKPLSRDLVEKNRTVIERELSLDRYGERLEQIYQAVMAGREGEPKYLKAKTILDRFIQPNRFRMLLAP